MSSKLKTKKRPKQLFPYANTKTQHLSREVHASVKELDAIWKEGYMAGVQKGYADGLDEGFKDGQEWTNVVNTMCIAVALNELHGFAGRRISRIVNYANILAGKIEKGECKISELLEELESKHRFNFSDKAKELLDKYNVVVDRKE